MSCRTLLPAVAVLHLIAGQAQAGDFVVSGGFPSSPPQQDAINNVNSVQIIYDDFTLATEAEVTELSVYFTISGAITTLEDLRFSIYNRTGAVTGLAATIGSQVFTQLIGAGDRTLQQVGVESPYTHFRATVPLSGVTLPAGDYYAAFGGAGNQTVVLGVENTTGNGYFKEINGNGGTLTAGSDIIYKLSGAGTPIVGDLVEFTNGEVADADDVNGNFQVVRDAVNTLQTADNIAYIFDQKESPTAGGTSTGGAINIRDLNTIVGGVGFASLGTNRFTLQPGTYDIRVRAPGWSTNAQQAFLRIADDATSAGVVMIGASTYASAGGTTGSDATIEGILVVATATTYEVAHYIRNGVATFGLGLSTAHEPGNLLTTNIFTEVRVEKLP